MIYIPRIQKKIFNNFIHSSQKEMFHSPFTTFKSSSFSAQWYKIIKIQKGAGERDIYWLYWILISSLDVHSSGNLVISIYLISSSSFLLKHPAGKKILLRWNIYFFRKRCTSAKFSIHPNEFYMRNIIILCLFFYFEKKDSSNRKTKNVSFLSREIYLIHI